MSFRCQNEGKEARSRADIQNAQGTVVRNVAVQLPEPAGVFFVLKFPEPLRLKGIGSPGPVAGDLVFSSLKTACA